MTFWISVLLFFAPSMIEEARDPVNGWVPSDVDVRDLECDPVSIEEARRYDPRRVSPEPARQDFLERDAVICRQRLIPHGMRRARDEAILTDLRFQADEMAGLVAALQPAERERTWLVEVFYPDSRVSQKIDFAVKNALMVRGVEVTDRVPALAAGDIEILGQLDAKKAYPLACIRWMANGSLGPKNAVMGVVMRDRHATVLNVGVCVDGGWRWLY